MAYLNVKEAKAKLQSFINELDKIDENAKFIIELDDNSGGSYTDDLSKFTLNTEYAVLHGEVWLTNL